MWTDLIKIEINIVSFPKNEITIISNSNKSPKHASLSSSFTERRMDFLEHKWTEVGLSFRLLIERTTRLKLQEIRCNCYITSHYFDGRICVWRCIITIIFSYSLGQEDGYGVYDSVTGAGYLTQKRKTFPFHTLTQTLLHSHIARTLFSSCIQLSLQEMCFTEHRSSISIFILCLFSRLQLVAASFQVAISG